MSRLSLEPTSVCFEEGRIGRLKCGTTSIIHNLTTLTRYPTFYGALAYKYLGNIGREALLLWQ
jgi:hypothetical protein